MQLSFFVSGVISFLQASALRMPRFRRAFNMTPIPDAASTGPASPYKGAMNVAKPVVVLPSTGSSSASPKTSADMPRPPPSGLGKLFAPALKPFQEIKQQTKGVVDMANEKLDERRAKSERSEAQRYEEKRQRELKRERWEREQRERDQRAARKATKASR